MAIITDLEHYRKRDIQMSCQCEIYEICAKCAPSQEAFLKAVTDHDEIINRREGPQSSVPSYTLAELEVLAREYVDTLPPLARELTTELAISGLLAWLARREKESIK